MADRRNPYDAYRKPHGGQSVWGGMINNPKHPDIQGPYSNNWQDHVWNSPRGDEPFPKGPAGGSSVSRKPKPTPFSPAGGMSLPLPRVGAK